MPQKFDWKPDESVLDFEASPDPPADYRCCLQWNHPGWDKTLENHVLTRGVREDMVECHAIFPTFWAPELLDERNFRKFCYYAEKYAEELSFPSEQPKNYLPHDWRDKPQEWEEIQKERREVHLNFTNSPFYDHLKEFLEVSDSDTDDSKDDSTDHETQADTKQLATPRVDWKKVKRVKKDDGEKPSAMGPPVGLLSLDNAAQSRIAEYLDPVQWWYLRQTCTNAKDWPKPTPNIDYDFVYFAVGSQLEILHGVAHTLNDVYQAILDLDLFEQHGWQLACKFEFIKFDRRQPFVPLMEFKEWVDRYELNAAVLHDLGQHYFGVKSALPLMPFRNDDPDLVPSIQENEDGDEPLLGYGLGIFLRWCDGLEPKERINLEHFGTKKCCCSRCGMSDWRCQCDGSGPGGEDGYTCVMYYSPKLFGDGRNYIHSSGPADQEAKSWIVFGDEIMTLFYD